MITFRSSAKFDKQATIILVEQDQLQKKSFSFKDKEVLDNIQSISKTDQFTAENGQIFPFTMGKTVIVLVGIGKQNKLSLTALRISVKNTLQSSYLRKIKTVEIIPHAQTDAVNKAVIEGVLIGTYVWNKYKTKAKDDKSVDQKSIVLAAAKNKELENAIKICEGTNLARDLVNENADVATSSHIEKVIKGLIKGKKNVSVEILNKKELKTKGLGLHLAVNQGSINEPKLVIVKYSGGNPKDGYTALVGKGMTFDTGGLNLKPTNSIETMRMDMSGTATVVGTLKNVLSLNLKKNIIFACGLAENVTSARAYKPGDVIKGYAGKTVEVLNTDAEGRLVLADAISYIVKNYKPARLIDIATLTGACVVALGLDYTGLVTDDDLFSRQLIRSSNETDDRVWRLPMYPELKNSVKSKIADISNLGAPRGAGGTITAAEFLRQFATGTKWAHLDIAGTAFVDGLRRMYFGHGATGSGVRLLTHFLQTN